MEENQEKVIIENSSEEKEPEKGLSTDNHKPIRVQCPKCRALYPAGTEHVCRDKEKEEEEDGFDTIWSRKLPPAYSKFYKTKLAYFREMNVENDPILELQADNIARELTFYQIILDYETRQTYTEEGEEIIETGETKSTPYRQLYLRVKHFLGDKYDSQKHSQHIENMITNFTKRTELGRREYARVNAFVKQTIKILKKHLCIVDSRIAKKINEELGALMDKILR